MDEPTPFVNRLRRIGPLMLLALLLLGTATAQAASWYQVELIIFEQGGAEAMGEESWPPDPGQPDLSRALELSGGGDGLPFQQIGNGALALNNLSGALSRGRGYRVLWHGGWRQAVRGPEGARPLHLAVGQDLGREYGTGAPAWELEGTATLSVSRYLHLNLDLLLRKPMTVAAPPPVTDTGFDSGVVSAPMTTRLQAFRLQESRRMRSSELHYFDHPLFGVLALITPLD